MNTELEATTGEVLGPRVSGSPDRKARPLSPSAEVLVVEDDEALLPILEFLIEEARPGCAVAWAKNSAQAESLLADKHGSAKLRVVIADLFIQGDKNGVELWRRYGGSARSFLVISGASRERFLSLVPDREAPLFLPKPLDLDACVETLRLMLENPGWY